MTISPSVPTACTLNLACRQGLSRATKIAMMNTHMAHERLGHRSRPIQTISMKTVDCCYCPFAYRLLHFSATFAPVKSIICTLRHSCEDSKEIQKFSVVMSISLALPEISTSGAIRPSHICQPCDVLPGVVQPEAKVSQNRSRWCRKPSLLTVLHWHGVFWNPGAVHLDISDQTVLCAGPVGCKRSTHPLCSAASL